MSPRRSARLRRGDSVPARAQDRSDEANSKSSTRVRVHKTQLKRGSPVTKHLKPPSRSRPQRPLFPSDADRKSLLFNCAKDFDPSLYKLDRSVREHGGITFFIKRKDGTGPEIRFFIPRNLPIIPKSSYSPELLETFTYEQYKGGRPMKRFGNKSTDKFFGRLGIFFLLNHSVHFKTYHDLRRNSGKNVDIGDARKDAFKELKKYRKSSIPGEDYDAEFYLWNRATLAIDKMLTGEEEGQVGHEGFFGKGREEYVDKNNRVPTNQAREFAAIFLIDNGFHHLVYLLDLIPESPLAAWTKVDWWRLVRKLHYMYVEQRTQSAALYEEQRKQSAAIKIQVLFRRVCAALINQDDDDGDYHHDQDDGDLDPARVAAAENIYMFVRCCQAKRKIQQLRISIANRRATKVQALFRGRVARRNYHRSREAAVRIQRQLRMLQARANYHQIRDRVLLVQPRVRGHVARRSYQRSRAAARLIQAKVRGALTRGIYKKALGRLKILRATVKTQRIRGAARLIQARVRGVLVRLGRHNLRRAPVGTISLLVDRRANLAEEKFRRRRRARELEYARILRAQMRRRYGIK